MRRVLVTLTLAVLLLVGCTAPAPDPEALFAGTCAAGRTRPCRTIFADQSAAAKAARVEHFLQRFTQAHAAAAPAEVRIEIVEAEDGGTVLRCHGPQAACEDFFRAYQHQSP
jgi:hypothetical protein